MDLKFGLFLDSRIFKLRTFLKLNYFFSSKSSRKFEKLLQARPAFINYFCKFFGKIRFIWIWISIICFLQLALHYNKNKFIFIIIIFAIFRLYLIKTCVIILTIFGLYLVEIIIIIKLIVSFINIIIILCFFCFVILLLI